MTAVERVLEYRDLDKEKEPKTPSEVSVDWPEKGRIEFRNVVYRYFGEADAVLKNLSFVIEPMEKIGIVGRTGAGTGQLYYFFQQNILIYLLIYRQIVVDWRLIPFSFRWRRNFN